MSQSKELKLLSSSHHKMQMMAESSSVERVASAMKEYCEGGTIDNNRNKQRLSYTQLMLQTFSKQIPNAP